MIALYIFIQAAKIMYDTIMSYLKDTLLADFSAEKLSLREELLSEHQAFLSSRCNIFVHGEIYLQQLNKHLLSGTTRFPIVEMQWLFACFQILYCLYKPS
jgi:hypothetical protein